MNDYVLIVSTNKQILNTVYKFVHDYYKLLIASSKEEVEELLTSQDYEISVVLIDDDAFGSTGLEKLRMLQQITYLPHYIPLIKERSATLITQLMQQGAFDCLIKPFSAQELLRKIDSGYRLKNLYEKITKEAAKVSMKAKEMEVFQSLLQEQLMKQRLKTDVLDIEDMVDFAAMIQNHAEIDAIYEGKKLKERVRDKLFGKIKSKILIVEDEEDYQSYLKSLLCPVHDVVVCSNAVDGINTAAASEDIDIVLLDIRMPYMDGIDALPLFKQKRPESSVIMLTANDESQNIVRALQEGALDYCVKPIIAEELLSKIGQALEEKFYPKVMDEMIKEIHMKHISEERRSTMLHDLCLKRQSEEKPIFMEEILIFFPNVNAKKITDIKVVKPKMVLDKGVTNYIQSLL